MTQPADIEWDAVKPLAAHEFEQIRQLAHQTFGLDLRAGKEELVSARLRRLVRGGSFRSFKDYYEYVRQDRTGQALANMIDALATNHTAFLREPDHFTFLRQNVLPGLAARDRVELWSAACSTGEEVWTLGCILNEDLPRGRARIFASDISNKALHAAQRGHYPVERCAGLPLAWLSHWFVAEGRPPRAWQVAPQLRALAEFRRINLVDGFQWPRPFPVIFCRNVMIYFDRETQEKVVRSLAECLEPGGYLFVGHAESLTRISHSLEYVQPAVYRKPRKREGRWNRS